MKMIDFVSSEECCYLKCRFHPNWVFRNFSLAKYVDPRLGINTKIIDDKRIFLQDFTLWNAVGRAMSFDSYHGYQSWFKERLGSKYPADL